MSRNFAITDPGIVCAAGAVSAAFSLGRGSEAGIQPLQDVMVYNPSSFTVFVRAGGSGVTAAADCMPILPGEKGAYEVGSSTHVAIISPDGAASITLLLGRGR